VCALEGCDSSRHVQSSTCRHVNWALFSCHSKINPEDNELIVYINQNGNIVGTATCILE
jgi:hypothetical protein